MGQKSCGQSKNRFPSLVFCRLFIFKDFPPSRELNNFSKHLSRDSIESNSTGKTLSELKEIQSNSIIFIYEEKNRFIIFLQPYEGLWDSSASLHRDQLVVVQFLKLKCGFSWSGCWCQRAPWSPLVIHQGWVICSGPQCWQGCRQPKAGLEKEHAATGSLQPFPRFFLLKPGNMEGWKANALKRNIYGPWSVPEQQGLCWKRRAIGKWWQSKLKPVLASSFGL